MNPLDGIEILPDTPTVDPLWKIDKEFNVICFLNTDSTFKKV